MQNVHQEPEGQLLPLGNLCHPNIDSKTNKVLFRLVITLK